MTREQVLEFVKANPASFMATVDGGKPSVRAMHTALVEPVGLTFCTGVDKDVHRQLVANPSVELAYWDQKAGVQVRVRGEMQQLDDPDLKKRIVEEVFTFLKPVVEQFGYDVLSLFRLAKGTSVVWRAAQGMAPMEVAEF